MLISICKEAPENSGSGKRRDWGESSYCQVKVPPLMIPSFVKI